MNSDDVRLVQQSWKEVVPIAATAAELFYRNLFTLDPGLEPLFRGDMKAQGEKLMTMIGVAVNKLDDIDALLPVLHNLGKRHAGYGVKDHHYESVAAALLATLSQGLGDAFTPAMKRSWIHVYDLIANTMMAAAHAESHPLQGNLAYLPERVGHSAELDSTAAQVMRNRQR
jgi:hemoglobin-like flavoprotein